MIINIKEGDTRIVVVAQGVGGPQGPVGPQGPQGEQGEQGPAGQATIVRGTFGQQTTPDDLPEDGLIPKDFDGPGRPVEDVQAQVGESLMYQPYDTNDPLYGHVYTYTPENLPVWSDLGSWVGPEGPPGGEEDFVNQHGDTMDGNLNFITPDNINDLAVLKFDDPSNLSTGAFTIQANEALNLQAPTLVLNSDNPVMTMPGALIGSLLVVAGLDNENNALLGYKRSAVNEGYSQIVQSSSPITIKTGGSVPPTDWVELGLSILVNEELLMGSATVVFNLPLLNTTTRTGIVEYGLKINSSNPGSRSITQTISANYNGISAYSVPLINGIPAGALVNLVARVIDNNNNAFTLEMNASSSQPAIFQLTGSTQSSSTPANPIGSIIDYAGTTAPNGWLMCYGQELLRAEYEGLFNVIGTTYGAGNGTTSFNIPDLRGRVVAGQDDMGGTSANRLTAPASTIGGINGDILGAVGGEEAHVQTLAQLNAHAHNNPSIYATTPSTGTSGGTAASGGGGGINWNASTPSTVGSSSAFNVVQPTIILNKIIKY